MLNGRLRVAVQLTDGSDVAADDVKNNNNKNNIETPPTSPASDCTVPSPLTLYQLLQVNDSQTLHIQLKHGSSVKQRFDHVTYAADDKLNIQVCLLLDKLVLKQQNCCLLFFDAQRDGSNLIFLFKLLITEFNSRLEQLEASICKIHLMYMKSDDNTKDQDRDETISAPATATGRGVRVCHFESTFELLKWLLNVYRLARSAVTVYESLEISFCIKKCSTDAEQMFDVKLSLFNLYFTKMDEHFRTQLFSYVLTPEQRSEPFQHTFMTSLLRDHLELEAKSSKLLLCNIPPEMQNWKADAFLLTTVIKLYERFGREAIQPVRKRSLPVSTDVIALAIPFGTDSPSNGTMSKPRSISFNIPFNETMSKKTKISAQKVYTNEYLNKLRIWYSKLDDGFAEATQLMERYYTGKYDSHVTILSQDIKQLSQSVDLLNPNQDEDVTQYEGDKSSDQLCQFYTEYKSKLQQLNSDVEASLYAEDLKAYLCTKQFAHSQQILSFKLQQLESCKQRLIAEFNEEITALSSLLYVEDMK